MKKSALLLRIAGGLALFVCLGHTAGTFMPIPPEQTGVANAVTVMKATLVPMPVGKAQSYADIFLGNNISVSLYLLVTALGFFFLSGKEGLAGAGRKLSVLLSLGMLGLCVISALFFFPLPAVCTGLAGILGIVAARFS
jgi:hypothetical protein